MARTLARKIAFFIYFIVIMFMVAKSIASPESYIDYSIAMNIAKLVDGEVNADSIYDAFFYIDFLSVLVISVFIFIFFINLIKIIRK